jgi:hypothetical protein
LNLTGKSISRWPAANLFYVFECLLIARCQSLHRTRRRPVRLVVFVFFLLFFFSFFLFFFFFSFFFLFFSLSLSLRSLLICYKALEKVSN